jgi:hypothetical protein
MEAGMTRLVHPFCAEECGMTAAARRQSQGDDWLECGDGCILLSVYTEEPGVPRQETTSLTEVIQMVNESPIPGEPAWLPSARQYEAASRLGKLWLRIKWWDRWPCRRK